MPASKKGRGEKKITHVARPIPLDLALRLQKYTEGKKPTDFLLTMPGGSSPWGKSTHNRRFREAVKRYNAEHNAELPVDGDLPTTIYSFRHSSIVRELLGGLSPAHVAKNHDTSVAEIERHYAAYISDHAEHLTRGVMLDAGQGATGNVVPIR